MIDLTVLWSNADDAIFDHDYYLQKHIPMLGELLGDGLKSIEVVKGIGGLEPGSPPPYGQSPICISTPSRPFRRPLARISSRSLVTSATSPTFRSRCRSPRS